MYQRRGRQAPLQDLAKLFSQNSATVTTWRCSNPFDTTQSPHWLPSTLLHVCFSLRSSASSSPPSPKGMPKLAIAPPKSSKEPVSNRFHNASNLPWIRYTVNTTFFDMHVPEGSFPATDDLFNMQLMSQ